MTLLKNSSGQKKKKTNTVDLHPRQILVSGYSGVGKTTLICALIRHWQDLAVGYVKHDGHRFAIDHEGKDTWRAYEAGAAKVAINDSEHSAQVSSSATIEGYGPDCADIDVMVVEGHKLSTAQHKVLVIASTKQPELGPELRPEPEHLAGVCLLVGDSVEAPSFAKELKTASGDPLPYLHRNKIEEIAALLKARLVAEQKPPVAVVLAGGQSSRMGQDKALLDYHGQPQVQYLAETLGRHCDEVALSVNGSHLSHLAYPSFADQIQGFGPLGALATAMVRYPQQPILLVACDLPYIDDHAVKALLAAREPLRAATCFASRHNGLPEPMFAIYEPSLQPRVWALLAKVARGQGKGCPRKLLLSSRIALKDQGEAVNLANANTQGEYQQIRAGLKEGSAQRFTTPEVTS